MRIKWWLRHPRRVLQFVGKLWAYKGVLWYDYDWDYSYLYYLLLFKLKRMERALNQGLAIREKHNVQSLRLCIALLDRLIAGAYHDRSSKPAVARWGDSVYSFGSPEAGFSELVTSYPKAITAAQKKQAQLDFLNAACLAERIESRDRRNLFAIMGKYLPYWWD